MPGIVIGVNVKVDHLVIIACAPKSVRRAPRAEQEVPSGPLGHAARYEKACASVIGHSIHPGLRARDTGPHGQAEGYTVVRECLGMNLPEVIRDATAAVGDRDGNAVGRCLRVAVSRNEGAIGRPCVL